MTLSSFLSPLSLLASLCPQEGLGGCSVSSFTADTDNWKSCVIAALLHGTACLMLLRLLDARVGILVSPASSEIPFTGLWFIFQGYSCKTWGVRKTRYFKILKMLVSQTEKCSALLISTQLKSTRRRERQPPVHISGHAGFHCRRDQGTPLWNQWKSILPQSDRLFSDLSRIFLQIANWLRIFHIMKALASMHVDFLAYFLYHCGSNKQKWRRSEVICGSPGELLHWEKQGWEEPVGWGSWDRPQAQVQGEGTFFKEFLEIYFSKVVCTLSLGQFKAAHRCV